MGLTGTKQVTESKFSPYVKGNQWSITAVQKRGRGLGGRGRREDKRRKINYNVMDEIFPESWL